MLEYICYQLLNTDPFIITPGVKYNIIQPSIIHYYIVDPSNFHISDVSGIFNLLL